MKCDNCGNDSEDIHECTECGWEFGLEGGGSCETFEPCDNCDLPDACEDFGCAIKSGVRRFSDWT